MHTSSLRRGAAVITGVAASVLVVSTTPAFADHNGGHGKGRGAGAFAASLLVADQASAHAPITDADLVNPWGIAFGPTTPLWVANNGTSTSTLYRTDTGPTKVPLVVQTQPAPTGIVFNDTTEFNLPDGTHANFLFDSLSGQLSAWPAPPVTQSTTMATVPGAAFTGLALAHTPLGGRLYAADAASTDVLVYDGTWKQVDVLHDYKLPRGLTTYNVAVLGDKVYVSYAPPPGAKSRVQGAIDVYDLNGNIIRRLATGGALDGPWGMAIAPAHWGQFGGALLVGNEENGRINAFDPRSGRLLGTLRDAHGKTIGGAGLWGLQFGNGVIGTPNDLVIAIGTHEYAHGVVELVRPAAHK